MPTPPLLGTYTPPAVRIGEVVTCLYRDRECRITSLTAVPIPWTRCPPISQRGESGF